MWLAEGAWWRFVDWLAKWSPELADFYDDEEEDDE